MIFLDELKDLTLYKKKFFLPINEKNKRKGSAVFLLTPNYESSKQTINLPYIINKRLFECYYLEKNISFLINDINEASQISYDNYIYNMDTPIIQESIFNKFGFKDEDLKNITTFTRKLKELELEDNSNAMYISLIKQLIKTTANLTLGPYVSITAAITVTISSTINAIITNKDISDEIKYQKLCTLRNLLHKSIQAHKVLHKITINSKKKSELNNKIKELEKSKSLISEKIKLYNIDYKLQLQLNDISENYYDDNTFNDILSNCTGIINESSKDIQCWNYHADDFFNLKKNVLLIIGENLSNNIVVDDNVKFINIDKLLNSNISKLAENNTISNGYSINLLLEIENKFISDNDKLQIILNTLLEDIRRNPDNRYVIEGYSLLNTMDRLIGYPIIIQIPSYPKIVNNLLREYNEENTSIETILFEDSYNRYNNIESAINNLNTKIKELSYIKNLDKSNINNSIKLLEDYKADLFNFDDFINGNSSVLYLIGSKWSDKNRLGDILAERYNCEFINLDDSNNLDLEIKSIIESNHKTIVASNMFSSTSLNIVNTPKVVLKPISIRETYENMINTDKIINNDILLEIITDINNAEYIMNEIESVNAININSVSLVILDKNNNVLTVKDKSLNKISLPWGIVNKDESPIMAVKRIAKENLNIDILKTHNIMELSYKFTYDKKPGLYYNKEIIFLVDLYEGIVDNNIPDLYSNLSYNNISNLNNSNLYTNNIIVLSKFNKKNNYSHRTKSNITFSGYDADIQEVQKYINPSSLYNAYKELHQPFKRQSFNVYIHNDISKEDYIDSKSINILSKYSYNLNYDNDYETYIKTCLYTSILIESFPKCNKNIIYAVAEDYSGLYDNELDTEHYEDYPLLYLMRLIRIKKGYKEIHNIMRTNDINLCIKYGTEYGFNDIKNIIFESSDNPSTNIKNLKNRIKRRSRKGSTYKINKINKDIEKLTYNTARSLHHENFILTKDYIESAYNESDYICDDNTLMILGEAKNKNDEIIKKTIYNNRFKTAKEVLLLYDRVKRDIPEIRKTYTTLNKYNGLNLFIDLSYYNEVYFRNNMYKSTKGYKLYLDMIKRLITNIELPTEYKKRTVFIPICDWDNNPETNMWFYKKDINPISIIYGLMKENPRELVNNFKGITFVFLSPVNYFKMEFTNETVKNHTKFISLIKLLLAKGMTGVPEPDPDNTPRESTKAITLNILDKLEKAKGIKIDNISINLNKSIVDSRVVTVNDYEDVEDILPDDEIEAELGIKDEDNTNTPKEDILVSTIETIASDSADTEDAIERMDDERVKELIDIVSAESDETPRINNARKARFVKLDLELRKKKINNKTISEILDGDNTKLTELQSSNLPVSSINDDWHDIKFINFDANMDDINDEIIRVIYSFTKKSYPMQVRNINIEDISTSEDWIELFTVDMEDFNGTRFSLKFEIPIMVENEMKLRGNKKTINIQSFLMPVVKTDIATCQIVSNYKKIFISRFGNTIGKSFISADRLIKSLNKYMEQGFTKIKVFTGDNSNTCAKYELPIDYIDMASVYNSIEIGDYVFLFNQDIIRTNFPYNDKNDGIPYGYDKSSNKLLYYKYDDDVTLSTMILFYLTNDNDFKDIFESTKNGTKYVYSKASIMSSEIPLIVVAAFTEGLSSVLKKASIKYEIVEKLSSGYRNKTNTDFIKFSDAYLIFINDYNSSLLLNGLKECNTEDYSIKDIDSKSMWYNMLDLFGGRRKADGLDNFADCMIDPITAVTLEQFDLPDDYVSLLCYANSLLIDNRYERHNDIRNRRLRRGELIAAYTYNALSESYGVYAYSLRNTRSRLGMTIKRSAVIDKIMADPTSSDGSCINALNAVETRNTVSTKGMSGMNADRAYGLVERTYDDSMLNVFGMSTGFAGNVGVTRQATIDADIRGDKGFIVGADGDTSKLCTTKTLTATEAMTPFGSTRDDPFRTAMTFIQTAKHQLRTYISDPLLVTYGMDEALPYYTTSTFANKAKKNGEVVEFEQDNYMIVKYSDNTAEFIDLSETLEKNSDGGCYTPMQKTTKLKLNSKFKKNDIIAYDKYSFSNSLGESDNLAYNAGTLMKIAILNTDEGFEDSACITEDLAQKMGTDISTVVSRYLPKETNVYKIGTKGQSVEEGDVILTFQTPYEQEDIDILLKNLASDEDEISELGRIPVKSKVTGVIADVKIYRTVEIEELSESLQKIVKAYESNIKKREKLLKSYGISTRDLPPTYKLAPAGKLKNCEDGVFIEFYLKYQDLMSVGDKLVYFSANKGVVKYIIPKGKEPYTDFRKNEPIDAFISIRSVNARMVCSIPIYGAGAKLMVELDRTCKDMAGILYDDSKI